MKSIKVNVVERRITFGGTDMDLINGTANVLQGGVGVDSLEVTFDDEWDGFSKRVVFEKNGVGVSQSVEAGTVAIPGEMLETTGRLNISFVGTKGNTKITTYAQDAYLIVATAGAAEGRAPSEPTVSDLETTRANTQKAADAANAATANADKATSNANAATAKANSSADAADTSKANADKAAETANAAAANADKATEDAKAATADANKAAEAAKAAVAPTVYLHFGTRSDGSYGPVLTTVEEG